QDGFTFSGDSYLVSRVRGVLSIAKFPGKSDGYCGRILRAQGTRKEGYNEFRLRVEGDPENYQPGSTYRVTLYASSPAYFRGFTLIALREGREGDKEDDYAGNFQVRQQGDLQLYVIKMIQNENVDITTRESSVLLDVKRIIYFQDEGSLTKRMCEKESLYGETTEKPLLDCCACGTAKYRVTFHGNWSEKVHPKDYPRRANHWSAIIGASHSKNYVLWEYGGYASEGIKKVAELGSPVSMEEEIRQKGDDVLTVIKMKAQWPAWQPLNVRAAPSAEFSVDRTRHLMSFLTMLGPSPDWNVGLSAEDLCTKECGWAQRVVQDMIPWDAGTDNGVTYESPNKPTVPQEKIRPLTSLDHPQSPFYDPEGGAITPVARVVVERIARKGEQCNVVPDNVDDIVADIAQEEKEEGLCLSLPLSPLCVPVSPQLWSTCTMSEWITWSPCSMSCGMGLRSRERYVKQFPDDGSVCTLPTEENEKCIVNEECTPNSCLVTEWGEWDSCSATCGLGMKRRERMVKMPPPDGSICGAEVLEVEKCMMPECHTIPCMLSPWSDWSDCSVTCGKGMRTRQRVLKSPVELGECTEDLEQVEKCMLPECPTDCMVSEWTEWSECNKSCGKGHMIRTRMVKLEPQFGGDLCPETVQRKKCKIRKCNRGGGQGQVNSDEKKRRKEAREKRRSKQGGRQGEETTSTAEHPGCKMRPWSNWTDCTKLCGGGIQERLMTAKRRLKSAQLPSCKDRKEIRACNVHPC
uniref:Spondin-1 n=1 Tax=Oncorhynchus kisutch TaxID=8019 RepID=A0A8C7MKR9_ONCKI